MPLDGPCCVSGRPRSHPGFVWGVGAPVNAWTAPRPVYGASSHVEEIREPIRAARMYAGLVAVAILVCFGVPVPSPAIAAGAFIRAAFLSLFVCQKKVAKNRKNGLQKK